MSLDQISTADVDQEWARLSAGISDPDELAEEMQQKMIAATEAIQLYLTVKRANGSCGEVNYFCGSKLFNAIEELFMTW